MFDRIFIAPKRTERVYETREVHEHRAPTDDSVKLLREMESKARAEVIKSVSVANILFSGVINMERCAYDDTSTLSCIFQMNGQNKEERVTISNHEYTPIKAAEALIKKVAERIAFDGLRPLFAKLQ